MDIQAIVEKIVSEIQKAPEMLQEFAADPGAAIQKITGDTFGDTDIAAIAEGVMAQLGDTGDDIKERLAGIMESDAVHDIIANVTAEGSKIGDMIKGLINKQ